MKKATKRKPNDSKVKTTDDVILPSSIREFLNDSHFVVKEISKSKHLPLTRLGTADKSKISQLMAFDSGGF